MSLLSRKPDSAAGRAMRAVARQRTGLTHDIDVREHHLVADEPEASGGEDSGPDPQEMLAASLASCTAITMEMYAKRKGWNVDGMAVDCRYTPADRGCVTSFEIIMQMPAHLSDEQMERLRVIAAKCPIHRVLEGEVAFDERVELA